MARNVPEPPPGPGRGVYWRRRATVLTLGIGAASLLGWTVTGVLGGAGHAAGAAHPGGAATGRPGPGGSASGRPTPAAPPATGTAALRARLPGSRGAGTPGSGGTGTPGSGGTGTPSRPPAGLPPACAPRHLVLSLAASQGGYGPAAQPQFEVFVVSVGARDCSVNVGPAALSVVVKQGGTRRIWDSAGCARGGARFVQLSRGVPRVLHFRWDRRGSPPGCGQAGPPARLGTYTATAVAPAARLASQATVFVLTGPGVGMP